MCFICGRTLYWWRDLHQPLSYLNIFSFICFHRQHLWMSRSLSVPGSLFIHQMWDQKSLATCLSACLRVRLHVHMHANSSGRHGQLSGEADNSLKWCPWFRVLMNSTAEEAPDREPCMVNDWLLMQSAFGCKVKEKGRRQFEHVLCLNLMQDGKKNPQLHTVQTLWTKGLPLREAAADIPGFRNALQKLN